MYADTGLIISKLCALAKVNNDRETEALGNAMFGFCAMLIPHQLIADEAFLKDRSELTGRPWSKEGIKAQRPFALSQFLAYASIVEELLRNGQGYIKDGKLSLADIHLVFLFQWALFGHKGVEPEVSKETHPVLYNWASKVLGALKAQKPKKVTFDQVKPSILAAKASTASHDSTEPLKLSPGSHISVTPMDTGKNHPQIGALVFINSREICLKTEAGATISLPRVGYMIGPVKKAKL